LAMKAMERGKDVMVEKPLGRSVAEVLTMMELAAERQAVLMVGHTFEYHAAVWKLRAMVQSGELGDLYYLNTARLNLGLYQNDVNVLFDLAPHDISILNYVLSSQPDSVECWASRHAHRQLEDVGYLRLHYPNPDLFANVHVSWLDPCKVRTVTAVGSERMVVFNDLSTEERIRVHNKGVSAPPAVEGDITQPPMSYRYGDVVSPYLVVNEPLSVEDQHFVDCVLTRTRPQTDGANGLAVVAVLEAAERSIREHRAVQIDEVLAPSATSLAGLSLAGVMAGDQRSHSQHVNGEHVNGEHVNGEHVNGVQVNGGRVNGGRVNGHASVQPLVPPPIMAPTVATAVPVSRAAGQNTP
jgi:predicted dehydrogenase